MHGFSRLAVVRLPTSHTVFVREIHERWSGAPSIRPKPNIENPRGTGVGQALVSTNTRRQTAGLLRPKAESPVNRAEALPI